MPWPLWFLVFLPAVTILGCILYFAIEVPVLDDWDTPGHLYQQMLEGDVSLSHFFSQHNESRKVIPKIISGGVGLIAGYRVSVFSLLAWFIVFLTFLLLLRLLPRGIQQQPQVLFCSALLLGLLVFSPAQQTMQLQQAIAFAQVLPPLYLALSLWIQSLNWAYPRTVVACCLLSVLATFSFVNGMLCWLLACPFFRVWLTDWPTAPPLYKRTILTWTGGYFCCAGVALSLYFWDYHSHGTSASFQVLLHDPGLGLQYFMTWVGAPLTRFTEWDSRVLFATLSGSGLLLVGGITLGGMLWTWRRTGNREIPCLSFPWICFTSYGLLSGLMNTVGRTGMGLDNALASRYSSYSLWVPVGLIGSVTTVWLTQSRKTQRTLVLVFGIFLGAMFLAVSQSWLYGLPAMHRTYAWAQQNLFTLRLLPLAPHNPLLTRLHPRPEVVRERGQLFFAHHFFPFEPIGDWLPYRLTTPSGWGAGQYRIQRRGEKSIQVTGRAQLPQLGGPPDAVLLARFQPPGKWELVTGLIPQIEAAPLEGGTTPDPRLAWAVFNVSLETPIREDEHLGMFAVDLSTRSVYSLSHVQ